MKQVHVIAGYYSEELNDMVNNWIAEAPNKIVGFSEITDIHYAYSDGCSGVMITYEVNNPNYKGAK